MTQTSTDTEPKTWVQSVKRTTKNVPVALAPGSENADLTASNTGEDDSRRPPGPKGGAAPVKEVGDRQRSALAIPPLPGLDQLPTFTEDVIEQFSQTTSSELPYLEAYIKVWSKAIDTQMHFNEMSVRSRQLGLTFVVTALGLAGVVISQGKDYPLKAWGHSVHVSVLIIVAAAGALTLVRTLDLGVYHRMLRGAVAFGEDFEAQNLVGRFGLVKGMTQAISLFSRYQDVRYNAEWSERYRSQREVHGWKPWTWNFKSPLPWTWWSAHEVKPINEAQRITAERKIRRFYAWTIFVLVVVAGALGYVTRNDPGQGPADVTSGKK